MPLKAPAPMDSTPSPTVSEVIEVRPAQEDAPISPLPIVNIFKEFGK